MAFDHAIAVFFRYKRGVMPTLDFHIKELDSHIVDPITTQLIGGILKDLNATHLNTPDTLYVTSDRRKSSTTSNAHGDANTTHSRCDVEVRTITNPASLKWDIMTLAHTTAHGTSKFHSEDSLPLFVDQVADVRLVEVHFPLTLSLSFSLKLKTIEEARLIEASLISKYYKESKYNTHDFSYAYPLDTYTLQALFHVYKMRSEFYNKVNFIDYIQNHSTSKVQFLVDKTRAESQLTVKRVQINALGLLEHDQEAPEPLKEGQSTDRWELKFTYTVQFQYPNHLKMYVPVTVENELTDPALINADDSPYDFTYLEGLLQERSFNTILREMHAPINQPEIRLPFYDDWIIPHSPAKSHSFRPLLVMCFTLDENITAIPFKELGDINIHPVILDMMQEHGQDIFTTKGIFNIGVFSNDHVLDKTLSHITPDLNVLVDVSDKKKRYHIVLSEATDLRYMDDKYIRLLMRYRWYFPLTIARNLQRLIDLGHYTLDRANTALMIIEQCMYSGNLDKHIRTLIHAGHVTHHIFQYTATAYQFCDYLMNTRSLITGRYLFDEMVEIGLNAGCIKEGMIPRPYVRGPNGWPIHQPPGGSTNGINTPIRIFNANIIPNRTE